MWKKVLIITATVVVVLGVSGKCVFDFYIKPVYLDKITQKAQNLLNDQEFRKDMNEFANQMVEEGILTDPQVKQKIEELANMQSGLASNQNDVQNENSNTEQVTNNSSTDKNNTSNNQNTDGKNTNTNSTAKDDNKKQSYKGKTPTERVLAAMTPDEISFAMSVYNKIDVGKAQSLAKTDKAAAKQYVQSRLSSGEISRALSLYSKYSYLLND